MQNRLTETIKKYRHLCDYMEIRVEEFDTLKIEINTAVNRIKTLSEAGGNIRVLVKGRWGFTSFNDLSLMNPFAERAIKQAEMLGKGKSFLSPVHPVVDFVKVNPLKDPKEISKKDKLKFLNAYNEIILNYDRKKIQNSIIDYMEEFKKKYFANSEGTYVEQELMNIYTGTLAIATGNGITQVAGILKGSADDFSLCEGMEEEIEKSCREAIIHLDAPKVKSGIYTVICDPKSAGTFVHEAFGHNCEADRFLTENPTEDTEPGKRVANKILSVYDTGLETGRRGAIKYDDEGVRTEKTYLIKEGVLSGKLHTRETAALMGEAPTGSARALNYKFPPICRMRTTCIEKGKSTFSDMIKDIKKGIYTVGSSGGRRYGDIFIISPDYSYMIRNGEIAEPVREVKIKGNLFETLKNIDMTGQDFTITEGNCGKEGQYPLPVSEGSPHIRIQNITVGGEI